MTNEHERLADDLDAAWDQINERRQPDDLAARRRHHTTLALLLDADDAPEPDPDFLRDLRQRLMDEPAPRRMAPVSRSTVGVIAPVPFPAVHWRAPVVARAAIAVIAAMIVLALALGGKEFWPGGDHAPMVASAMASAAPTTAPRIETPSSVPAFIAVPLPGDRP